jgi:hypothetical protein
MNKNKLLQLISALKHTADELQAEIETPEEIPLPFKKKPRQWRISELAPGQAAYITDWSIDYFGGVPFIRRDQSVDLSPQGTVHVEICLQGTTVYVNMDTYRQKGDICSAGDRYPNPSVYYQVVFSN